MLIELGHTKASISWPVQHCRAWVFSHCLRRYGRVVGSRQCGSCSNMCSGCFSETQHRVCVSQEAGQDRWCVTGLWMPALLLNAAQGRARAAARLPLLITRAARLWLRLRLHFACLSAWLPAKLLLHRSCRQCCFRCRCDEPKRLQGDVLPS